MKITFVKKIKADGSPCRKCADVEKRLLDSGYVQFIDETVIADEREPQSPGMQLARQHCVEQAPFFLVEESDGRVRIYTIYFQLVKEVLQSLKTSTPDLA